MPISALVAYGSRHFLTNFLQEGPTPGTGPYFDTSVQPNVTGLVGKTVLLVCKVKNLGNRTVRVDAIRVLAASTYPLSCSTFLILVLPVGRLPKTIIGVII